MKPPPPSTPRSRPTSAPARSADGAPHRGHASRITLGLVNSVLVGDSPSERRSIKERRAMLHLRRSTAAVLLYSSAVRPWSPL